MKNLRLFTEFKAVIGRNFYPAICWFFFSQYTRFILPPYTGIFPSHLFVRWNNSVNRREFFIFGSVWQMYRIFLYVEFCCCYFLCSSAVVGRVLEVTGSDLTCYTFSHGKQVTEIFRYKHYLAPKMSRTLAGKKTRNVSANCHWEPAPNTIWQKF